MSTLTYTADHFINGAIPDAGIIHQWVAGSNLGPSLDSVSVSSGEARVTLAIDPSDSDRAHLAEVFLHGGKAAPTPDESGRLITAPTFEDTAGLRPQWRGHLYTATAGSTSIFDEVVTTERELRGGWYELFSTDTAKLGDYVELSIVDKDDVLGLFAGYGMTVGTDILELQTYIKKEYVNPTHTHRNCFAVSSTFTVMAGLYLRTKYESTGINDVDFKVVFFAYE